MGMNKSISTTINIRKEGKAKRPTAHRQELRMRKMLTQCRKKESIKSVVWRRHRATWTARSWFLCNTSSLQLANRAGHGHQATTIFPARPLSQLLSLRAPAPFWANSAVGGRLCEGSHRTAATASLGEASIPGEAALRCTQQLCRTSAAAAPGT